MNYAKIDKNDITNGEGVCVSLWIQGCPIRCEGCHNSEIWEFNGGQAFTDNTLDEIFEALSANSVQRNFSVLGGEPLAPQNVIDVANILYHIKERFPDIKIYIWTGYEMRQLTRGYEFIVRDSALVSSNSTEEATALTMITETADYIIDGPYIAAERDITLKLRGSRNQHIWQRKNGKWEVLE